MTTIIVICGGGHHRHAGSARNDAANRIRHAVAGAGKAVMPAPHNEGLPEAIGMRLILVANDFLSWGFVAIMTGSVLWVISQHGGGFGMSDTMLRLAVIALVSAGTFAVGLDTAEHTYLFDQTTQDASIALSFPG